MAQSSTVLRGTDIPVPVSTRSSGHLMVNDTPNGLQYKLEVANLVRPTRATLRIGLRGHHGPPVVTLPIDQQDGVLSQGTITDAMLAGCLEGHTTAALTTEITRGHVFALVSTEMYPKGEIRGQLEPGRRPRKRQQRRQPEKEPVPDNASFSTKIERIAPPDEFNAGSYHDSDFDINEFKRSIGL